MKLLLKNLEALFIPSLLSVFLSLVVNSYTRLIAPNWFYGFGVLFLLCLILNIIYTVQQGSKKFTELLLTTLVIKLLLALITIVVYMVLDKPGLFNFSIHFIIQYVLFTIFEIRYLLFLIKTQTTK